ncbi:MAG: DinB family protein [Ferruginibacter sp.]
MKKLFEQYAAYNLWANQRLTEVINNMPNENITKEIPSSFSSIYKTLLHLWDVENIWWQRLKLAEHQQWPGETFTGSVMELSNNLVAQSKQWKEWIDLATEAALQHEFIYRNSKKDQFKQPVYEMLIHLFNHQTYHRGQLITMMRQTGEENIPNTDLISFLRKK